MIGWKKRGRGPRIRKDKDVPRSFMHVHLGSQSSMSRARRRVNRPKESRRARGLMDGIEEGGGEGGRAREQEQQPHTVWLGGG